jgi:hypothetical protein
MPPLPRPFLGPVGRRQAPATEPPLQFRRSPWTASHGPALSRPRPPTELLRHGDGRAAQGSPPLAFPWPELAPPGNSFPPPLLCSSGGRRRPCASLCLSLKSMTGGPGWAKGPICRFKGWLSWVRYRVRLAVSIGLFYSDFFLNFRF